MAKTYIFAIGGTGARVMRSLTMLMASGIPGFDHNTEICPIIIDYDLDNGDKSRAVTAMNKYIKVRDLIVAGNADNDGFFSSKIVRLPYVQDFQWQFGIGDNTKTFADHIGYDQLDNTTPSTKKLIESFYDSSKDSEYTELNLNMKMGFQGNPNIGSVVFDHLSEDSEFNSFKDAFDPKSDRVVIIGSLFGGTGASGIPALITAMHNPDAAQNLKKANIAVVMVLPYFGVGSDKENFSVKSSIFNTKTKAALNYYELSGQNKLINSIYYVGDKVLSIVEPHLGDKDQKNAAHPVEMICAMAVSHFVTQHTIQDLEFNNPAVQHSKYKFVAGTDITDGISFADIVGEDRVRNEFVAKTMHNMIDFSLMMKYFNDELINNDTNRRFGRVQWYQELGMQNFDRKDLPSDSNSNPLQDFCAALYSFYCFSKSEDIPNDDGYVQWLQEMHRRDQHHGVHALKFFNFNCDNIATFIPECPFVDKKNRPLSAYSYKDAFDSSMENALYDQNHFQRGEGIKTKPEKLPWVLIDTMRKAVFTEEKNKDGKLNPCIRRFGTKDEKKPSEIHQKFAQLP